MNLNLKIHKPTQLPRHSRRGSTILLVLAMLTILLLLGIAFSYSTRLETQASNNYAQLAQARTSAASGLPMAMPLLAKASQGLTTTLQNWNTVPQKLQKMVKANGKTSEITAAELASLRQAGISASQNKDGELEKAPMANIVIKDLSGLINLNAIPDQAVMDRVVAAVVPGGDTRQKSTMLMALRGDLLKQSRPGNRPGTSSTKEVKSIDLRAPSAQIIDSLDRLKFSSTNGTGQPAFTSAEIDKLANIVTVFSEAPETFNAPDGTHVPRISLSEIEPKIVLETLKKAFPGKKEELLLQFAANLKDFSDNDDEPTILDSAGNIVITSAGDYIGAPPSANATNGLTANQTIGVEMTPFISEVYPDAATPVANGDDGQFVEIVNPWNKAIDLSGWTIRTKGGSAVALTQVLAPRGYLTITDNFNTPTPSSPPGQGSVVSLFGATANGTTKIFMVDAGLDLPDTNSKISLYNPQGQLVDEFAYSSTGQVDGKVSFQRTDPMVRGYTKFEATPMSPAQGGTTNAEMLAAATKAWDDGNTTMTKLSQLFAISTGFAEKNASGTTNGSSGVVHAGQLAELTGPDPIAATAVNAQPTTDKFPTNLDLRLVDVFTATPRKAQPVTEEEDDGLSSGNRKDAYQAFRRKMDQLKERAKSANGQPDDQQTSDPTVYSYGKINLNTCSRYALLGLNLDKVPGATNLAGFLEQFEAHRMTLAQQDHAPFVNVSDFITKFVPNLTRSNLDVLDSITDQVAVGSSAFEITSTNRLSANDQKALEATSSASGPRPATSTARWIISTDEKPYSIVSFTQIP